jgi:alpha-tubulin suppressor-like RCC1 family protein
LAAAGALALFAHGLSAQPLPNVIAWGDVGWFGSPPSDATNVVAASDGGDHALLLRADGTALEWGSTGLFPPPTNILATLTNVLAVAAAPEFSSVLRADGTVVAWGYYACYFAVPPDLSNPATALTNPVASLAAWLDLRADRAAEAWTYAIAPGEGWVCSPSVVPGLTNAVAVAGGGPFTVALQPDGTVAAAGEDPYGYGVLNVPPGLTNVVGVSAGGWFSMALRAEGTVKVWGDNTYGQTNVPPDLTNAVAIAAGAAHCLALRSDGTVVAWGGAGEPVNYGQTNVPPGLSNAVGVAAGGFTSVAIIGAAMPPAQVALTNMAFGPGGFTVQVPTDRQRVYGLEYKNSLTDARWTLLPLVAGTGATAQLTDPAPGAAQRFYRVRRW